MLGLGLACSRRSRARCSRTLTLSLNLALALALALTLTLTLTLSLSLSLTLALTTGALQPHLRTGDTFVDFACGLNTFAPLLKDPGTGEPLNAVAIDIFSPVDRTEHF